MYNFLLLGSFCTFHKKEKTEELMLDVSGDGFESFKSNS